MVLVLQVQNVLPLGNDLHSMSLDAGEELITVQSFAGVVIRW
jgi:hypothetical protein